MRSNEMKEQLIEKIKQEVQPAFIMLFGSFAKGTVHAESDIDIAYFGNKQLSLNIADELSRLGEVLSQPMRSKEPSFAERRATMHPRNQ